MDLPEIISNQRSEVRGSRYQIWTRVSWYTDLVFMTSREVLDSAGRAVESGRMRHLEFVVLRCRRAAGARGPSGRLRGK